MAKITYSAEGLLIAHEVDYEGGRRYEEELHERIVQGNVVHKQIQVSDAENNQIEFLSFAR